MATKSHITQVPAILHPNGRKTYLDYVFGSPGEDWTERVWSDSKPIRCFDHPAAFIPIADFTATLIVVDSRRGRSAAQVVVADDHGNRYTMFMAGFLAALQQSNQYPIVGTFRHVKKGSNYGIEIIPECKEIQ